MASILVEDSMGSWTPKHGYTDHMNDPDGDYMAASEIMRKTQGAGGCSTTDQSFPVRLHYMLNEIEADGLAHVISWAPHGRCFVVHKQKMFTDQVLGNWFRMSKYASFQRQLNIYGFQRLTTGPDKGGYFHELFLRRKPGLAYRIQRHKVKGTGTRKAASPELEPDFYHMRNLPQNKTTSLNTNVVVEEPPKLGALVAGPQGVCRTTTSGVGCSLRSLAPILLATAPPPAPSATTGFSVYSNGRATTLTSQRPCFTLANNSAATQGLGASSGSGSPHQRHILSFATAKNSSLPTIKNTSTGRTTGFVGTSMPSASATSARNVSSAMQTNAAATKARTASDVGPLVHPLLRENNQRPDTATGSNSLFTTMLSCPTGSGAATTRTTGAAGQSRSTATYPCPDFSWYM